MSVQFGLVGVMDGWKKGDLPGNQMVNITLDSYGFTGDRIYMTPQLATEEEVDHEINRLIGQLESIRKKAKAKIKRDNKNIRSSL